MQSQHWPGLFMWGGGKSAEFASPSLLRCEASAGTTYQLTRNTYSRLESTVVVGAAVAVVAESSYGLHKAAYSVGSCKNHTLSTKTGSQITWN